MKRKKLLLTLIPILLIITLLTGLRIHAQNTELKQLNQQKLQTEKQLHETQLQKLELEKSKATTEQQKQEVENKVQEQQRQIDDLNAQLQAKKAQAESIARAAVNTATATRRAAAAPAPASIVPGCGDNQYAQYIYQRESGCNLNAVNAGGCRGIGQACPGSKLPCGADYACQNAWFTNYAMERYGSWQAAYNFWVANHWW